MTNIEFYEKAVEIGTGSIAILNKGIELLKANGHGGVGDKAALDLGYDLKGAEYLVAAESTLLTYMQGGMEGKDMWDPANEVEAFERARDNVQRNVDLAKSELETLKAVTAPTEATETPAEPTTGDVEG